MHEVEGRRHRVTGRDSSRPGVADRECPRSAIRCLPFVVAILLAACGSQPPVVTPRPATVRVAASGSTAVLMEELGAAYAEARPWVTVQVEVFDDAVARERLLAGAVDLAALSWLGDDAASLWSVPFATDGVAIVVHPGVPLEELGLAELREIFRGRVGAWVDGTPVQVISREQGAGVRAVFEATVMDGYAVTLTALVVPDDDGVLEAAATIPGAIGYVSLASLEGRGRVLPVGGVLPVSGALPDYPLAYPVFLVAPTEPVDEARTFVQWVLGPEGQDRVARRFGPPDDR
jgi:phosphate transport system substrate-binding protein